MQAFERSKYSSWRDRDSAAVFSDMVFTRCSFESCSLSQTQDPAQRSTVRNVRLVGCATRGCRVGCAVLDSVVVEGLTTHGLVQVWSAALRHVVLCGRIGRIMFSPIVIAGVSPPEVNAAFRRQNERHYRNVDWALDIREADPLELELTGIPGRLIRRNPERSILVRAERIKGREWRLPGVDRTACGEGIRRILDHDLDDAVIVACERSPDFAKDMEAFRVLRKEGLAEPD